MNVLDCLGVGFVTLDKETDTDMAMVYCPLLFPKADGETKTTVEEEETVSQSPTGDLKYSKNLKGTGIPCKWLPINTNRATSPDVREGSKVIVYKFAGQNTYRWTYFGLDGSLRLETIIWAFSASNNIDENTPLTTDNFYILFLSTHQKKVQLLTGRGNGERVGYAITLDTDKSMWGISDTEENIISLNSLEHAFSFINQENSYLNIEKKNIDMACAGQMLLSANERIIMKADQIAIEATNINIKGETVHQGNITVNGSLNVNGEIKATGTINSDADVIAGGISVKNHHHDGVHGPTGAAKP